MTQNINLLLLVIVTFTTASGKYVHVQDFMCWNQSQNHCRTFFTDLAPISNEYDTQLLYLLNDEASNNSRYWIGLMRDPADPQKWLWSGGGEVKKTFWKQGEPNNANGVEDKGNIFRDTWNDLPNNNRLSSFCYKVHAVRERKTWEDALKHCREHHRDLASVASETELMLMQKELDKLRIVVTQDVWIGLRFLTGEWLWVDGQPYGYEAWGQGGGHWCPAPTQHCAALQVNGQLQSPVDGITVVTKITAVEVWNSHNCNKKLNFLCY